MAHALDPVLFARSLDFEPDDWQARILRSSAAWILVLCARQCGKSAVAAILALHRAVFVPGSLILVLCPAERQSKELLRTVRQFYRRMEGAPDMVAEGQTHVELRNGSRVLALPGSEGTVRGYSAVDVIIVDEAARVLDSLYLSVRPMLGVSGGRLIALSTPFGKRGWYWEAWEGRGAWERTRVTADQCPRLSAKFLREERQALGERWYRQEYGCSFEDMVGAVFNWEDIQASMSDDVEPLFAGSVIAAEDTGADEVQPLFGMGEL